MAFNLSDFWRWSKTDSTRYNNLVAAIAAWRPDEIEPQAILSRHIDSAPTCLLTDHNESPELVAAGLPTCEVTFVPGKITGPRMIAYGFFWPEWNELNPPLIDEFGFGNDEWDFFITTGTPYDMSYFGDSVVRPVYGQISLGFDPLGGWDVVNLRYGGGHVIMTTHVLEEFQVGHTKVAMFAPPIYGRAMLMVMSEDNS